MTKDDKGDPAPSLTGIPLGDALLAYWPGACLDYKRHYEFPDEPSPAVRATLEHLLRLLGRAKGPERDEIDLRINVLVSEEQARLLAERAAAEAPPPLLARKRRRGRQPWTRTLFDERYAEAVALAGGNASDVAVAEHFRGLDAKGAVGLAPETLARLRRRHERDELPE